MVTEFAIGGRRIGAGSPVFIIAEAGVNHNGDLGAALELVRVARSAGADAVKFQTFRADRLATAAAPKAAYQRQGTPESESQFDMLQRLELSPSAHLKLMEACRSAGIVFLSSPFDEESAHFLAGLQVPAFKIPSGEITNLPFLRMVSRLGAPLVLSTGMADLGEVRSAVESIRGAANPPLALLQCVSNYPAAAAGCNLRAMAVMRETFEVPVGFSDHTESFEVALAAVGCGACILEKHFTLDRSLPGPDHKASLDPAGLSHYVRAVRLVESALGDGIKRPLESEIEVASVARKSLVAAHNIAAGSVLGAWDVVARRPGTGISPALLDRILGRTTLRPIRAGECVTFDGLK